MKQGLKVLQIQIYTTKLMMTMS